MCRLFGTAASAPVDLSFELLDSENPLLGQSERHDSGWGIASYEDGVPASQALPEGGARRSRVPVRG